MASINLGVVGCIAASAVSVSAPTGVTIAEAASSGQNNAFRTFESADIDDMFDIAYSDWSSSTSESFGTQYEKEIDYTSLTDWNSVGYLRINIFAYLRATGATSFAWSGAVYSSSGFGGGSGNPSASIGGNSSNSQDSTGSSGTGLYFQITPGSGRGGGYNWPTDGNNVIFKLTGTATNSGGDTTADLYLKYSFAG